MRSRLLVPALASLAFLVTATIPAEDVTLPFGIDAPAVVVETFTSPSAAAQEDCFGCQVAQNDVFEEGFRCTQGQNWCHLHEEDPSLLGEGNQYWLNGHPQLIWLDGVCHNLCEGGGSLFAVAAKADEMMAQYGARLDDVFKEIRAADLVAEAYPAALLLKISDSCGRVAWVPMPEPSPPPIGTATLRIDG